VYQLLTLVLLASLSLASEINISYPSETVHSYYNAINEADLSTLKKVMVKESYDTDIQIYALSIALKDPIFHKVLKQYGVNKKAKRVVEQAVERKLKKREKRTIVIKQEILMGKDRVMVKFLEDSKNKQLYLSRVGEEWKINYLAGRKTD